FGQSEKLTATITGGSGTPTGTVSFYDGSTKIGSATLSSSGVATLTTTSLAVGTPSLSVSYSGNSTYASSTSGTTSLTVPKAASSGTVTSSVASPVWRQSVTLTATLKPVSPGAGTPSGTVTFYAGSISLGTGTLVNGVAKLTTTALPIGASSI